MKVTRTEEDLKLQLKEQIQFLLTSAKAYDEGRISEAKRLAVALRVLLHDTEKSTSLLKLLKKKDILFYDTALDYNPNNLASFAGLVMMKIGPEGGYVPPLDDGPPRRYVKGKTPFEEWWTKVVIVDLNRNQLTRRGLLLAVCNQDGGAHIDPKLDKTYADITRFQSLGDKFSFNKVEIPISGPEFASIRQISHEVLKSLRDEFPEYF